MYDSSIDARIGFRLRTFRLARGVTQTDLATHLGVTFQQVQKYEAGTNRMTAGRLYAAATLFRLPMEGFCRPEFRPDALLDAFAGLDRAAAEVFYQATVRSPLPPVEADLFRTLLREVEGKVAKLTVQLIDLRYFLDERAP